MRYLIPHNKQTSSWVEGANLVLAGPTSGANAKPTFRRLIEADLPANVGKEIVIVETSGTNDYTGVGTPTISSYADHQIYIIDPEFQNTTSCTLNIDGVGQKGLYLSTFSTELSGGEMVSGGIYVVQFLTEIDGFVLLNPKADPTISTVSVTVTSAELKSDLNVTPIEIIPAASAGSYNKPLTTDFIYSYGTATYSTSGGTPSIALVYDGTSQIIAGASTSLITQTVDKMNTYGPPTTALVSPSDIDGKSIVLKNSVAGSTYITGDGTLKIVVNYLTITL